MRSRILVVEDDTAHAELIRRTFRGAEDEFEVSCVGSLSAALAAIPHFQPHLILSDQRLPDGRGEELLGQLGFSVPVVLLTAFGSEREAVQAVKNGAMDYITKSAETFADMRHLARRALREWGYLQDKQRMEKQMRQALERAGRQQKAIAELAMHPAVADGELPPLARLVTEKAAQILEVERASVWLLDPGQRQLRCHDLYELSRRRHSAGATLSAAEYEAEMAAFSQSAWVSAPDAEQTPCLRGYVESYLRPLRIVSLLDAAIRWEGRCLGILCLESVDKKRCWEPDEVTFACQLADQLSLCLANHSRRQAEMSLRQSEERFRRMVETAHEGIWVTDTDEFTVFVNDRMAKMLGYEINDMLGREATDFLHPDSRPLHEQQMRLRRDGVSSSYECWCRHANGEYRWMSISASPIFDHHGRFAGAFAMFQDATERRRALEMLRQSEAFFRAVWESARDGFRLTDGRGIIILVNEAFCQLFGKKRDELLHHSLEELYAPAVGKRILEAYQRKYHQRSLAGFFEQKLTLWNGREVWLAVAHSWLDVESTSPRVLSVFRDITASKKAEADRLEMERQLLYASKLESLGVLAGGIAHDFNNLLTAILGNLEMAMLDLPAHSPVRACLAEAEAASNRAAELSRQMLAYTGRGALQLGEVSLNSLIRELEPLLRASVPKTSRLEITLDDSLPLIRADASQIQQIVVNLVTNAAEAIGEQNGLVALRTGVETCSEARLAASRLLEKPAPGVFVFLEVRDNGCGMTPEVEQKLFDPFFSTKFQGRGLGMAVVHGVVRGLKGAIFLNTAPGQGTTLQVLLPAVPAPQKAPMPTAAPPAAEVASPPAPVPATTILVVDDEEAVLDTAARLLQRGGYRVLKANNGDEAIRLVADRSQEIHCAVVDLTMPQMDGLKTSRELLRLRPDLPILLASGYDAGEVSKRAGDVPVKGFLQKPFTMHSLLTKLEEICEISPRRPAQS